VALATGLSLLFLWLAVREVPISQISAALDQVNGRFVSLAVGLTLAGTLARAARWKLLYYPDQKNLNYLKLAEALFIGQMLNIIIPARLGEVARIQFMGQVESRSQAHTLGTIAVEKMFDILALLVLMFLVPVSVSLPAWFQDSKASLLVLVIAFFGVSLILSYGKDRLLTLLESTVRFLPEDSRVKIQREIGLALSSLDVLRSPWVVLRLQGWSFLIWSIGILINYITFLALGLSSSFTTALFLLVVLQVGIAVPSVPGKLGIFQYLCILALAPFGFGKSSALSYSVLLYLVAVGPVLLLGAFFMWWEGIRGQRVKSASS
jgi:uncharacterized protein (TIRG00374 family)